MTYNLVFLCIASFFAAFVDSISGGGSIISIPAFLIAGVPPHIALGTNKFASGFSTLSSSLKFTQSSKVNFKVLKYLIPASFFGAILGVLAVLSMDSSFLQSVIPLLLILVGIYSLFSKKIGSEDNFKELTKKNIVLGILLSFVLGFYDGFLGAGVGVFYIFGLISIFKFDFVRAAGNCKVLNFAGNISAIAMFALKGQVSLRIGIPVAICMVLGARFGTKIALNKGAKLIKPIFVTMSLVVASKMLFQL
jgi:uncharacterized protein